ncbi:putative DNA binding domain-containing protein [Candidatus Saganbacteria bacterium]|nr:putative DNA binding domain-containing protein [Candidatus Saganbacteria bacterium]
MSTEALIRQLLALPAETRTLEFKRLGSRNEGLDKTLQSIVAMANTDGGLIVLGVDDPQRVGGQGLDRICGIEENLDLYDELGRTVKKISPPIPGIWPPEIFDIKQKGVRLGLLFVPKVTDGFRSYENHVYVRLERGNKRLSPQELVHFAYVKGFERADCELVDVPFHLLNTKYYEVWRKKRAIEEAPIEVVLEKTGLARKGKGETWLPTRAAVLLFAEHPTDLLDTKCAVRVFQYTGKFETIKETINLIGTPKTIGGPISKQILEAHEYVLTLLRAGIRVPSGFVTTYQIPERAIKEAITNAVIHRDYYTKRDIEIKIFEDKVTIESPGLFPFNITPSNIGIERALGYRNDLLVKHLREFPDPPNLDQNEGIRAMRKTMKEANLYPPIFVTYPDKQDSVQVVLINEKAPGEWDKISHYLGKNKYISNKDARAVLEISDTVKVSKLFNRWAKRGLLVKISPRTGAKKLVRYRLPSVDEKNLFSSGQSK